MCSNRASSGSDGYSRDELAEMCRESHAAIFGTILWSKSSCQRTCCFRNTPWASKSEGTSCHVHWCKQLPRYKCCFCQATSHKGALSALADLFGEIDCFMLICYVVIPCDSDTVILYKFLSVVLKILQKTTMISSCLTWLQEGIQVSEVHAWIANRFFGFWAFPKNSGSQVVRITNECEISWKVQTNVTDNGKFLQGRYISRKDLFTRAIWLHKLMRSDSDTNSALGAEESWKFWYLLRILLHL